MSIKNSSVEKLEAYMKEPTSVENFDKDLIDSMKKSFPDVKSIDNSFSYFHERPAAQGTYSFIVNGEEVKGRYRLLLVKEQTAICVFSRASKLSTYDKWNKEIEKSVASLKTY